MARIEQGILGSFSGKVGEVIGSSWKGIPYIKARPTSFHDPKTPRQLTHRMKLQMAHGFVKSIKHIVEIGFRNVTGSYQMKNALVGEYPEVGIAPSKVMVSQGKLAGAEDCSFSVREDGNVVFSWEKALVGGNASADNQALLLVYNFTKMQGQSSQTYRKEKSGSVRIPKEWSEDSLACYMFFASVSNENVSNSEFLGMVEL